MQYAGARGVTLRYTKIALVIFGVGMVLGLVVVAGEFSAWERAASTIMALALVLIPVTLFVDSRGLALLRWFAAAGLGARGASKSQPRQRKPFARRKKPARAGSRKPSPKRGR